MGHSPWGCKELDTTERLILSHASGLYNGAGSFSLMFVSLQPITEDTELRLLWSKPPPLDACPGGFTAAEHVATFSTLKIK